MTCIIVEDQGPAQEILEQYVGQTEVLQHLGTFTEILEAGDFMKANPVDLLFLDINLPKMSGMDFLRNEHNVPKTILTTAYSEFALECFEYNVIDYLLKPFAYQRFLKAVRKAMGTDTMNSSASDSSSKNSILYVKAGNGLIKLDTAEVLFIKSDGDYTEIITRDEKYLTSHSLKEWPEKLNDDFIQVHRSYIVHMKFVQKVAHNKIHLNKESIPIGRVYKSTFLERLKRLGKE